MKNITITEKAKRAADLFPCSVDFSIKELEKAANALNVIFSKEIKQSYVIYPYDFFTSYQLIGFPDGVIEETLRLRKDANLPKDTLILSEDDASILLMRCLGDHEEIYWMAVEDYYRYCDNEPLEYDPTIFPTFTDFFSYLLDEEEKRRADEKVK